MPLSKCYLRDLPKTGDTSWILSLLLSDFFCKKKYQIHIKLGLCVFIYFSYLRPLFPSSQMNINHQQL